MSADSLAPRAGAWAAGTGGYTVLFSLAALDFFRRHANWRTPASARLARAAYCVYIIHPLGGVPLTYGAVGVLRARGVDIAEGA